MPKDSPYKTDSSIVNLGDHREPNMEAAVGVQPDLIINGQRFEDKYDQFKQLVPEAALVDIDIRKDKPFGDELKRQVNRGRGDLRKEGRGGQAGERFRRLDRPREGGLQA